MNILTLDIWVALWKRLGTLATEKAVMTEYINLCARYAEPHRAHHNLLYIEHCLSEWKRVSQYFVNPDAAMLALWYHDAIYNPEAKDNEEQSVILMREVCRNLGQREDHVERAARHIMATKHHSSELDADTQLFLDIDLAILGAPQERFDEYERGIRTEYKRVPENVFRKERAKILRSFLARETVFYTTHFQHLETQALKNLTRSIHALRSKR